MSRRDVDGSAGLGERVDRIRAPLLVVRGATDPRVPIGEAGQIVGALRARGAPLECLRFEDERHGLVRLGNRLAAYPAIADFLGRALAGATQEAPGKTRPWLSGIRRAVGHA